jgi:hypothetical protein
MFEFAEMWFLGHNMNREFLGTMIATYREEYGEDDLKLCIDYEIKENKDFEDNADMYPLPPDASSSAGASTPRIALVWSNELDRPVRTTQAKLIARQRLELHRQQTERWAIKAHQNLETIPEAGQPAPKSAGNWIPKHERRRKVDRTVTVISPSGEDEDNRDEVAAVLMITTDSPASSRHSHDSLTSRQRDELHRSFSEQEDRARVITPRTRDGQGLAWKI